MIPNLDVVQVRHQEVRFTPDTDLGQVHDGDIKTRVQDDSLLLCP